MADHKEQPNWNDEDAYWRTSWRTRPYAADGSNDYDRYQPGYRYGFESANQHAGRDWTDVESDLRSGWDRYENRGTSTWDQVKDAVRDAWDRVTGTRHAHVRP